MKSSREQVPFFEINQQAHQSRLSTDSGYFPDHAATLASSDIWL